MMRVPIVMLTIAEATRYLGKRFQVTCFGCFSLCSVIFFSPSPDTMNDWPHFSLFSSGRVSLCIFSLFLSRSLALFADAHAESRDQEDADEIFTWSPDSLSLLILS